MVSRCNGISFLLLLQLLLSSCEGRPLPKVSPPPPSSPNETTKEEQEKIMVRSRIGSRPPSCERRCAACGHCEAVQVPAVPQQRRKDLNSRADDSSNYKPVSWKCQCSGIITDP